MATLRISRGELTVDDHPRDETITLEQWNDGVRPEAGRFALAVPNDADVEELGAVIANFDAVALSFPHFRDGRAYSQARLLRERLNFSGEVRATGAVVCDQALFMARAGFDALDIGEGDVEGFRRALRAYSAFYQSAVAVA